MQQRLKKWLFVFVLLLPFVPSGCIAWPDDPLTPLDSALPMIEPPSNPGTYRIYFFREPNYRGAGRVHLLKLDGKKIGTLTDDNYYRIELWPGEYHLAVYLPTENFLGNVSPPTNTSMQLTISSISVPGTDYYRYLDGHGIEQIDRAGPVLLNDLRTNRSFLETLDFRDTAQVKFLFDTRYDGPANKGKAHGIGTLTWEDGSTFRGRFVYGEIADEGLFYTPSGRIYMGPTHKGRPVGPGVWMADRMTIDYAGSFLNEVPHGTGIRSGSDGPEFCDYQKGKDVTKTFRQLALEAIETDHQRAEEKGGPQEEKSSGHANQSKDPFVGKTHYERILAKEKEIKLKYHMKIEEKRAWCRKEFDLGRRLCICAPFAADFNTWKGCDSR